jgi:hypothetical protein
MKNTYEQLKEAIKDNPKALKLLTKYKNKKNSQLLEKSIDIENNLIQQKYLMNYITIKNTNEMKKKEEEKCIPQKLTLSIDTQKLYNEEKELLRSKIMESFDRDASGNLVKPAPLTLPLNPQMAENFSYLNAYNQIVKNEVSDLKTKIKRAENAQIELLNWFKTTPDPLIKSIDLRRTTIAPGEEAAAAADEVEEYTEINDLIKRLFGK